MTRAKAEAEERAWIASAIRAMENPSTSREDEERAFKHDQRTRLAVFRARVALGDRRAVTL